MKRRGNRYTTRLLERLQRRYLRGARLPSGKPLDPQLYYKLTIAIATEGYGW